MNEVYIMNDDDDYSGAKQNVVDSVHTVAVLDDMNRKVVDEQTVEELVVLPDQNEIQYIPFVCHDQENKTYEQHVQFCAHRLVLVAEDGRTTDEQLVEEWHHMDRNDRTVADEEEHDDTTVLHAVVVVEIEFGLQQHHEIVQVQHDTVVVEEVVEDTSDLFVDTVIQFCLQERIQHQVDVDRTDDDDTVAVQETDTSVEQVQVHGDMVAYVLPAEVVEETRYADDKLVPVAVVEIEFGLQQHHEHEQDDWVDVVDDDEQA